MVMPGDDVQLTLKFQFGIAIETGQRFTLRDGSKTVGTGIVIEVIE